MSMLARQQHRVRDACRLCGGRALSEALVLADTPPANAFSATAAEAQQQERFPLRLAFCEDCQHLQLIDVVDPELLFSNYVYVSGTSPAFVDHFDRYAAGLCGRLGLGDGDMVIDIGSNDGTLLKAFAARGCSVLGIDPAQKIAAQATADGIETIAEFFDERVAADIVRSHGAARLVTANNVFAHVDGMAGFAAGISSLLADDGSFVFEVSYLADVYRDTLFDTIYHEHLDYHRVGTLRRFFERLGMVLYDVERVATHGGSLRGYAANGTRPVTPAIEELEQAEIALGLDRIETFADFGQNIARRGEELSALLDGLKRSGREITGYGAPAKATTLMHHFGIDGSQISAVIDDSPWKQGLFTPGMGIPVHSAAWLAEQKPDYLLILAWNFADPIIANNLAFAESGGRFILPLPNLTLRAQ